MKVSDPSESSGYVLWKLTHAMQQRMTGELAEVGLNLPQLGTLVHIARGDVVSTADLARTVLMTPQNMSLTVRRLEAEGHVVRRPHETHGRINRLELTPSGHRVLSRAITILQKVENEMFHDLSGAERKTLVGRLRTALENLQSTGDAR